MRHVFNPFAPLHLSHVTFQGTFDRGVWSSTLYDGDTAIARVRSTGPEAPLELEARNGPAISRWLDRLADPSTFIDTLPPAAWPMQRLSDLVDRLAQLRYLDRRISVLSHSRVIFQLRGDQAHEFHYLPKAASPEEQLGWLRLAAGKRLTRVIFRGRDCLALPPAEEAPAPQALH
jgi:hypothetical protein